MLINFEAGAHTDMQSIISLHRIRYKAIALYFFRHAAGTNSSSIG